MDELERRVRESLRERADDVEATPVLWAQVQERAQRRRRLRLVSVVAAVAAAVVLVGVGIPLALETLRSRQGLDVADQPPAPGVTPSPTETPIDSEPTIPPPPGPPPTPLFNEPPPCSVGADGSHPSLAVTTDGLRVSVRALCAVPSGPWTIHALPEGAESRIVEVSVRPGSRAHDLTIAYLEEGEGMYALGWIHYDWYETTVQTFPAPYQLENRPTTGSVPAPVWSPDGRELAWVEDGEEGPALRVIGWANGPGTGRPPDDNTALGNPGYPQDARVRLQSWLWHESDAGGARGLIQATDDQLRLHTLDVERQGDGAIAIADPVRTTEGAAFVDWAAGVPDGDESTPRYLLEVTGAGEGTADLTLTVFEADDQGLELAAPDELEATSDPASIWMTAADDGVLIGGGGEAWLVTALGATLLDGTVLYGDFVPGRGP